MLLLGLGVAFGLLAGWKFWWGVGDFLVGNPAENVRDAIEACSFFIIGGHDAPRGGCGIGCSQHGIAGAAVVVPAAVRLEIHGTQLPAFGGILDARQKALMLLLFRDVKPVL